MQKRGVVAAMRPKLVRISLQKAVEVSGARKPGYVEAIQAAAYSHTGDNVVLTIEEYRRIKHQYALKKAGAGTALSKALKAFGIVPTANCPCNYYAALMDAKGPDWCEENIDTIVGWLRDEAAKRGLPFVDAAGRILIRQAIKKARQPAE